MKTGLRRKLLKQLSLESKQVQILETHGGKGRVWERVYSGFSGVVIEKNPDKTEFLVIQRPTWKVYEGDSVRLLFGGLCRAEAFSVIDVDPYGEPWPIFRALVERHDAWPSSFGIAVNDGLRQKLKLGGGWNVNSVKHLAERYGNRAMYSNYLAVCKVMIEEMFAPLGFSITWWHGYYCGANNDMTHYAAVLTRSSVEASVSNESSQ